MSESGIVSTQDPSQRSGAERAATWMVGGRLSSVLHLGDGPMAYVLSQAGHDVVVAGEDVIGRRDRDVQYVRTSAERLPFAASSFDALIAPSLEESPAILAEYARVLRCGAFLATMHRVHDVTVPWVRRLHDLVGHTPRRPEDAHAPAASGLFETVESTDVGAWEELDLPGLLRFAEQLRGPSVRGDLTSAVRDLFREYGGQTNTLRLRHTTTCLRTRNLTEDEPEPAVPETVLLDLG